MKIPILKIPDYDVKKQIMKITEEISEFRLAPPGQAEIGEALDVIQALITYLSYQYGEQEIKKALALHDNKFNLRGYERKGNIKLKIERD